MLICQGLLDISACRSPHGERGLKSVARRERVGIHAGRSPHGERGLKFGLYVAAELDGRVALLTENVD